MFGLHPEEKEAVGDAVGKQLSVEIFSADTASCAEGSTSIVTAKILHEKIVHPAVHYGSLVVESAKSSNIVIVSECQIGGYEAVFDATGVDETAIVIGA